MRTLSQISIADFVDVMCGDCTSLDIGDLTAEEQTKYVNGLIADYRAIADPSGAEAMVQESVSLAMAEGKGRLARVLGVLLDIGDEDDVREVLVDYGAVGRESVDLRSVMDRMLRQSEIDIKRIQAASKDRPSVQEVDYRSRYDSEFAFVMTHFHMTFDPKVLSASVYANMLHRADMELRARARALKIL